MFVLVVVWSVLLFVLSVLMFGLNAASAITDTNAQIMAMRMTPFIMCFQ